MGAGRFKGRYRSLDGGVEGNGLITWKQDLLQCSDMNTACDDIQIKRAGKFSVPKVGEHECTDREGLIMIVNRIQWISFSNIRTGSVT